MMRAKRVKLRGMAVLQSLVSAFLGVHLAFGGGSGGLVAASGSPILAQTAASSSTSGLALADNPELVYADEGGAVTYDYSFAAPPLAAGWDEQIGTDPELAYADLGGSVSYSFVPGTEAGLCSIPTVDLTDNPELVYSAEFEVPTC